MQLQLQAYQTDKNHSTAIYRPTEIDSQCWPPKSGHKAIWPTRAARVERSFRRMLTRTLCALTWAAGCDRCMLCILVSVLKLTESSSWQRRENDVNRKREREMKMSNISEDADREENCAQARLSLATDTWINKGIIMKTTRRLPNRACPAWHQSSGGREREEQTNKKK